MSDVLRLGIIGGGRIGKVHATSISRNVASAKILALADPYMDEELARWAASEGIAWTTKNSMAVLESPDIDAVLICSPTATHADLIVAAAQAGKHIFCEKPVDTDVSRIKVAMEAVKKAGVAFQIGFNRRFDHNFSALQQCVASGGVGVPHLFKITSRDPAPPPISYIKTSGGIFLDMMIHDFDMVRFLSASEVVEVYATGAVLVDPQIGEAGDVDTAVVQLTLASGALAVIDNSRKAVYGYDQRAEVFGSAGCARIGNDASSSLQVSTSAAVCSEKPLHFFLERYLDAYASEIAKFVDAVRNGTQTACGIEDALRPVEIALAATRSLREHRPVKLEPVTLA